MVKDLNKFKMPRWEDLPPIPLYLDQVLLLSDEWFGGYMSIDDKKIITKTMINNYVKLKIIPAPVKKKYSRVHIAYLVLVCTLKQTLDMATIQKFMPVDLTEERVMEMYNSLPHLT